jgi:hypothetical protein
MFRSPSVQEILDDAQSKAPAKLRRDTLDILLHESSPRVRFIKSLPLGAKVLDLGAGEGSMAIFKEWIEPKRPDLSMYALGLVKGAHFDLYDGYELKDFDTAEGLFPGIQFDAVYTSNFVEHIEGGIDRLAPWAANRLESGGMLYIEGPSIGMELLPHTADLIAAGLNVSTMNFFDDLTHKRTETLERTREVIETAGFFVEQSGYWRNRFLEGEALRTGYREGEMVLMTLSIWMKYLVEQYVVAVTK